MKTFAAATAIVAMALVAPAAAQTQPAQTTPPAGGADAAPKPKPKSKAAPDKPNDGSRVYKENGKTCSGLDQYKVCW